MVAELGTVNRWLDGFIQSELMGIVGVHKLCSRLQTANLCVQHERFARLSCVSDSSDHA